MNPMTSTFSFIIMQYSEVTDVSKETSFHNMDPFVCLLLLTETAVCSVVPTLHL